MKMDKETNGFGKYEMQNEVSWYPWVLSKCVSGSSLDVLILTVVAVIIIAAVMSSALAVVVWGGEAQM